MVEKGFKRKLAAILSADVQAYSRLMAEDEEATIRTLTDYREVLNTLIQQHSGKVVDSPGDNLLAEFSSVVDAVNCAVAVQKKIRACNAELPENRKMLFRIGINLGDVVEDDGRIYGDGVNIAARIEALAEAGGICISRNVFEQVKNKLKLGYEYLGERSVKNIPEPIGLYRIRAEFPADSPENRSSQNFTDQPSIAVLPFANISGDPEQEYFSDGITEDLITDLSQISGLFVIARHSVFTYKGKAVKVQEVSNDLKVRYVLEGSVRKVADRIRINTQLIDAKTGGHLWAERYDRHLKDIFAVQDEVTKNIVSALSVKLTEREEDQLARRHTNSLEAYEYALRGLEYYLRSTKEANTQAQRMLLKAIELDPEYSSAYSRLALTYLHEWTQGWSRDPKSMERAFDLAQKAIVMDESLPEAHRILGDIYLYRKDLKRARKEREKAIALDPNYADGLAGLGEVLIWADDLDKGIALVKKAMQLNPHHHAWYFFILGVAYTSKGRYEEAIEILDRALIRNPDFLGTHLALAIIYGITDRKEACRNEVEEILRISPEFSLKLLREMIPVSDQAIVDSIIEVLRMAGLPDEDSGLH
ncbi:MAG: tetratricopeptide repeat protein [Desulfobacteraceae bacterium]